MNFKLLLAFCIAALVLLDGCAGSKNGQDGTAAPAGGGAPPSSTNDEPEITIRDTADPVYLEEETKYIIVVRNGTTETMSDLVLSIRISGELEILSASDEADVLGGGAEWKIEELLPGERIRREVTAIAVEEGSASAAARLTYLEGMEPIIASEDTTVNE